MLYIVCPTCSYFLGKKTIQFESEKEKICLDPNLLDEEKQEKITNLLLKLNIRRYCCKARIMTYKDIVHIIAPIST